jgi:hypothetical protein
MKVEARRLEESAQKNLNFNFNQKENLVPTQAKKVNIKF